MTELNVFEDAASGYLVLENEGRIVKATPQQAMSLMVSLARRFGYNVVPTQQETPQSGSEENQVVPKETTKQPVEAAQEENEETETEDDDVEVEELFEEQPISPQVAQAQPKRPPHTTNTPTPQPPARPLSVAKQVEAKMLKERSPGKVNTGRSF